MVYDGGEPWWNDIDVGKSNNSERSAQCHFVHHRSHIDCSALHALLSLGRFQETFLNMGNENTEIT
jgi:hypothetical protein